jgi:ABC-type bacteriocin/lantibiotic exporter with double-glycine peptidase domain
MTGRATKIAICLLSLWSVLVQAQEAQKGVWLDVPFVRQEKNLCGAACVRMVLWYWSGVRTQISATPPSLGEISEALYSKETAGIQGKDMERYFEDHGYQVYIFRAEWSDLGHHLSKGRPLITCVETGGKGALLHYLVIAGIDTQQELVMVNDPAQRKLLKLSRSNFERSWEPTARWTLLALPRVISSPSID